MARFVRLERRRARSDAPYRQNGLRAPKWRNFMLDKTFRRINLPFLKEDWAESGQG
jgi:hypothetical protein